MKLRTRPFLHRLLRPAVSFIKFRILHVDDTSQRIAMGVAVGLWTAFTPLLGFHMLIALTLAALLRANKALAVLFVWLSNPLTLLPVYSCAYLVGRIFVKQFHHSSVQPQQVGNLLGNLFSFHNMLTCLNSIAYWKEIAVVFGQIGLEISIGGLILGILFGTAGYFVTLWMVKSHRAKTGRRRFRHLT